MANEFYARKGLAIATASVAFASGPTQNTKYLVLGDDAIVRWATASAVSGGGGGGGTGTAGTSGTSGTRGTSGTSGQAGSSGTSGQLGSSGTSGTSGTRGTSGTSGTSGTRGTSGTSGKTPVQGATYQFDASTTAIDQVIPAQGGFAYYRYSGFSYQNIPGGGGGTLNDVEFIQLTKTSVAPESLYLWDWFKTFNGVGTNVTYNGITYETSTSLQKGYLRIRSSTDNTYNIFKVVAMGYYAGVNTQYPSTSASPNYYLAVHDELVNNIINIFVDYIGSTPADFPTDNEQAYIDFSVSASNLFNQAIVADPAWSFQINDGATPANLASFGISFNGRNSVFLNSFTRNIRGMTSSTGVTVLGW
jgi:hypothetical protein